jgi:hypothetical protein
MMHAMSRVVYGVDARGLTTSKFFYSPQAPAYAIWRRQQGLDPDPNTPEVFICPETSARDCALLRRSKWRPHIFFKTNTHTAVCFAAAGARILLEKKQEEVRTHAPDSQAEDRGSS